LEREIKVVGLGVFKRFGGKTRMKIDRKKELALCLNYQKLNLALSSGFLEWLIINEIDLEEEE
jgi:hypothetical protein